MPATTMNHDDSQIELQITAVGRDLSESFRALFDGDADQAISASDLTRRFGMSTVFSHRLNTALRKIDPLGTIHQIPGPEPLRRLVQIARKKSAAPPELLQKAERAIDAFEDLIRNVAGDRSGLDAIISAWLPEARSRFESVAKQSAYRGMRQLKGIASDATFCCLMLHPGDDPLRGDLLVLQGHIGLRCLRPGTKFFAKLDSFASHKAGVARALDGRPVHEDPRSIMLDDFCSPEALNPELRMRGDTAMYALNWGSEVGLPSAIDITTGELRPAVMRRYYKPADPGPLTTGATRVDVPTKTLVFDFMLHKDIYPDWTPNVCVLDLANAPNASVAQSIEEYQFDLLESMDSLGTGVQRFRIEEIPNYVDMLRYACTQVGWDGSEFRGFRTRIEYPIFGSFILSRFDLPAPP